MERTSIAMVAALPLLSSTALFSATAQADFQRSFDARLNRAQEVVLGSDMAEPTVTPTPTGTPPMVPTVTPVPGQSGTGSGQQFIPAQIEGVGNATFAIQFSSGLNRANYLLVMNNVQNVIGAHLHCGRAGENGPIVVPLPVNNRNQNLSGAIRNDDIDATVDCRAIIGRSINNVASLLAAINEGLIYVNVHTQQYPDGFIRGQLFPGAEWSQLGLSNNGDDTGVVTPTPARTGG